MTFAGPPGSNQSVFFKHVYESEYGTLGGSPYTILVGDMELGRSPMDIQFLRDMSAVAAMAHAPFLASAAPGLLDLDQLHGTRSARSTSPRSSTHQRDGRLERPARQPGFPLRGADGAPDTGAAPLGTGHGTRRSDGLRRGRRWRRPRQVPVGALVLGAGGADHEVVLGIRVAVGDPAGSRLAARSRTCRCTASRP